MQTRKILRVLMSYGHLLTAVVTFLRSFSYIEVVTCNSEIHKFKSGMKHLSHDSTGNIE